MSGDLWNSAADGADAYEGETYVEKALELAAQAWIEARRDHTPTPLSLTSYAWAETMLKRFVPYWDIPQVNASAVQAWLAANAETWEGIAGAEFERLGREGTLVFRREEDPTFGDAQLPGPTWLMGVVTHYDEHPAHMPGFKPLHDYITSQLSYRRLNTLGHHVLVLDRFDSTKPEMTTDQFETYELSHRKAWHLGVVIALFDRLRLLPETD
ncbi:MAG: hypothetical protein ACJ757_02190 [Gaiellaceae bacterium]